jgi:predicted Fe-Mo cluster-binding NifX family protein
MKAAFSYKDDRIAPVLDVARHILIVEAENKKITGCLRKKLNDDLQIHNVAVLAETGIEILVCGAVSRPLHTMISACGIRVVPFLTGDLDHIVNAWLAGTLENGIFFMPGYGNRHRHGGRNREISLLMEGALNQTIKACPGQGSGRGMVGGGGGRGTGQGGCRQGHMRGQNKSGVCVCPSCGKTMPHERGIPCFEKKCPECGTLMTRG